MFKNRKHDKYAVYTSFVCCAVLVPSFLYTLYLLKLPQTIILAHALPDKVTPSSTQICPKQPFDRKCHWRSLVSVKHGHNTSAHSSSPAVPRVLFTSPGIVCVLFFNFTEQPKSPSLISPDEVRKILAPGKCKQTKIKNLLNCSLIERSGHLSTICY